MGVSLGKSRVFGCFDVKYVRIPSVIQDNLEAKSLEGTQRADKLTVMRFDELSPSSSEASIHVNSEMESVYSLDHTITTNLSGGGCSGWYPDCLACTAATYGRDEYVIQSGSMDSR